MAEREELGGGSGSDMRGNDGGETMCFGIIKRRKL